MTTRIATGIRLPPDAFAVVMATGIVSVALSGSGARSQRRAAAVTALSDALAWLAGIGFVCLVVVAIAVVLGDRALLGRLADPDVALRACAFVAACGVLEFRLLGSRDVLVWILAALELAGWAVLAFVAVRDLLHHRPAVLRDRAHGAWLLIAVATESLAITAADLALLHGRWLLLPAVVWWALGLVAYAAITTLLIARIAAAPALADEVTPDSWILMGALAIATLGVVRVGVAARDLPVSALAGIAHDAALACWGAATVWLPVLAIAEAVRFAVRPGSWHFRSAWWATVFPLGMYAVATRATGRLAGLVWLEPLSRTFAWISFVCWLAVACGLLHAAWRGRDRVRLPAYPIARGPK